MHECQEIRSANINQKKDRFLIYERDLLYLRLPTLNLKLGPIYVYYYIPQLKITTVIFSSHTMYEVISIAAASYATLQFLGNHNIRQLDEVAQTSMA